MQARTTLVEALSGASADAGSIPAASIPLRLLQRALLERRRRPALDARPLSRKEDSRRARYRCRPGHAHIQVRPCSGRSNHSDCSSTRAKLIRFPSPARSHQAEFGSNELRRPDHRSKLPEGRRLRQVLHSAVGSKHKTIRLNVIEHLQDPLPDNWDCFYSRVREIKNSHDQGLARKSLSIERSSRGWAASIETCCSSCPRVPRGTDSWSAWRRLVLRSRGRRAVRWLLRCRLGHGQWP